MKKLLWIFASALLLSNLFVSTGCGEDETTNPTETGPKVVVDAPETTVVIGQDETITFELDVTKGTNEVQSVEITEDGTKIDAARIEISGISTANNPQLVPDADKNGFTWTITINVHDAYDERTYEVHVADSKGKDDHAEFKVKVEEAISTTIEGAQIRLWNQGGPAGFGAIDLDTGLGTGVGSNNPNGTTPAMAELRDMGIDSSAASVDVNWRQRIAPMNNTIVKYLGNAVADFGFDDVNSIEKIEAAFGQATAINETLPGWGSFKVSAVVQKNDIFLVQKADGSVTYFVYVNDVVETDADNEDYYLLSIKY
jgi:hypothetical protein